MSKRNLILFIEDILESIEAIESYVADINSFNDFRNFIVHEYFGVNIQIVWDIKKLELQRSIKTAVFSQVKCASIDSYQLKQPVFDLLILHSLLSGYLI